MLLLRYPGRAGGGGGRRVRDGGGGELGGGGDSDRLTRGVAATSVLQPTLTG